MNVAHKIPSTQQISCCGLAISPDLNKVAVGDLAGNTWIYHLGDTMPCNHGNVSNPVMTFYVCYSCSLQIEASVRCIIWNDNSTILIGDLGGKIHKWNITDSIKLWATLEGSVIHMRRSHSRKVSHCFQHPPVSASTVM